MPTEANYLRNPYQYSLEDWTTSTPEGDVGAVSYSPGYIEELLALRQKVESGQASAWDREYYDKQRAAAMAVPLRDTVALQYNAGEDAPERVSGGSPDLGRLMLTLQDKMRAGTATPQESALFKTTYTMLADQNWRASVPQASDAFNPLGDQFFGALGTLALGASGGLAAAPLAAGGAGLTTTLGSLGTLAGVAGTSAGVLGQATDQDWLRTAGLALGAAGGVAGGVGGLSSLWGSGVQSLSDAAKLAQSAGKITGAVGRASGNQALGQASSYLGQAGQLGSIGAGVLPTSVTDWSTQRGSPMEWDYSNDWGASAPYDNWSWDAGATQPSAWDTFTGWGDNATQWGADYDPSLYESEGAGAGGWLSSVLGGLGAAGKFLGSNASWLGPAVSTLGSLGGGALGSRAAGDASAAQTAALNRGIDLQTAQWLQQQQNQAPWMEAGRGALGELTWRQGQEQSPALPGQTPAISGANYALPSATPGWTPQTYGGYTPGAVPQASQYGYQGPQTPNAGDYRWTPGQGPRAQDFRYTPGQTPDAAAYASGAPQLYQGAMPGTQVSTLTGQQVLDQDPGAAFRQSEARKSLEASALARGTGMSGATLSALQRQSQDLASQEYGNAWQRMMARDTEQYGRNWGQYQQAWNQGVQGTQLGLQTNAQNFGQAMSAAQLREQVNQIASQQGWSQAQAEAAFREQMAQQASQQGFTQALGAQGQQWQQGMAGLEFDWSRAMQEAQQREQGQQFGWQAALTAQQAGQRERQQYETDLYNRLMGQQQLGYARDVYSNETDYQRSQQAYQQQIAEMTRQWNQAAGLAGVGQTAVGQVGTQGQNNATQMASLLGQLGTAQGLGELGPALAWQRALGGATNNATSILAGLNR